MVGMTIHSKQLKNVQLQRLNEKNALRATLRMRQSALYRNIENWAEMSQSERKEFIEKLHWELNYTLRDIAKIFNKSWWWMVYYKKKYNIKVKNRHQSLLDKYNGHCPNWAGGRFKDTQGYWMLWVGKDYLGANKRGMIKEHRYVMTEKIGRPLKKYESVHHIDGDKGNNNPGNLQLMTAGGRGKFHGIPVFCLKCGFEIKQTFE